ncbi:MAG: hypothetical protein RBT49_16010 [Bacteroidales bacterium]|jgi:hypothetical protein|nr:hypothetical protein [Bacteroidales bacterium]
MIDVTKYSFQIEVQELNSPQIEIIFTLCKSLTKNEFEDLAYDTIHVTIYNWFQLSYFSAFQFPLTYYSMQRQYIDYRRRNFGVAITLANNDLSSLNNLFNLLEKTLIFQFGHTNAIEKIIVKNIPCDAFDYQEYKKGIL